MSSRSRSRAGSTEPSGCGFAGSSNARTTWSSASRVAQPREVLGGQVLGADMALGRGGRRRQVDVGDVGLDDLLRLEDLGEPVEPLVGHLDDADVELHPAEAARLGVAAGERVEDGRLARPGKPDDRDLHAVDPTGRARSGRSLRTRLSSRRPGRRRSAAARPPRTGGGCRRTARRSGRGPGRSTTTCAA